jgi:hypothetical protein
MTVCTQATHNYLDAVADYFICADKGTEESSDRYPGDDRLADNDNLANRISHVLGEGERPATAIQLRWWERQMQLRFDHSSSFSSSSLSSSSSSSLSSSSPELRYAREQVAALERDMARFVDPGSHITAQSGDAYSRRGAGLGEARMAWSAEAAGGAARVAAAAARWAVVLVAPAAQLEAELAVDVRALCRAEAGRRAAAALTIQRVGRGEARWEQCNAVRRGDEVSGMRRGDLR